MYLTACLQEHPDHNARGHVVVTSSCTRGRDIAFIETLQHIRAHQRSGGAVLVAVPPVYCGDLEVMANWSFAGRALREFVEICLRQHPAYQKPREQPHQRW